MRDVVEAWLADPPTSERIVHVELMASRSPIHEDLDPPLPEPLATRLAARGISRLYRHQARAVRSARRGVHSVVVAGTASGKSLCYQIPIAEAALADPKSTALLVFPTKALAQDQFRTLYDLAIPDLTPAVYDGDTDPAARAWARRHATAVLTNPDMLHVGILPNHGRWSRFLSRLRFVVVDEVHVLRGIFGSHVANVLRRLRRLAAHYGADPTFLACSATIGNPGDLTSRLTGLEVEVIDQDTAPAGARRVVLWNPEAEPDGTRRSALAETTDVFVDLVARHRPTIAFARSRKGTELVYRWARDRLGPDLGGRIAPYRAGYLPEERRAVERRLFDGDLLGVTTTNALELGIDVGGLDAAVLCTFPGTIASFHQQSGRAGRTAEESLTVLVAGEDALDQWFMRHPEDLFARPSEAAVVNPQNPDVLSAHMAAAAFELPLEPDDRSFFGEEIEELATVLAADGIVRVRDRRLYHAGRRSPAAGIDIRTAGGPPFTILAGSRPIGTIDEGRVFSQAHPGAVYLHQGDSYLVEDLDVAARTARVRRAEVGYYTQPHEEKWVGIARREAQEHVGRFGLHLGRVDVETHVVAFKRRSIGDGSVLGYEPLDLPMRRFTTQATWVTMPGQLLTEAAVEGALLPGTLHAAEHAAIALLPMFAICDRWDVGGLSTPYHPDVEGPVWFVYDGYPGGAGIAPAGFAAGEQHLQRTLAALEECPCDDGCPSCVQSPKCGNFNEPLDKAGAVRLLAAGLS